MVSRMFRNAWPYLRGFSRTRLSSVVVYTRRNHVLSLTALLGSGCALIGYMSSRNGPIRPFPSLVAAEQAEKSSKKKISRREKRYADFASKIYQDEIYMTPRDFMESLIKSEARLKHGYEKINDQAVETMMKKAPSLKSGCTHFMRDTWNEGLLTYADYLFLLTTLTKPQRQFEIAFRMMDHDGSNYIDKSEFLQVEEAVIKQRDAAFLEQKALKDSSLIKYLFGQKGNQRLYFNDFIKFINNFQKEVWGVEFHQYASGNPTINSEDFARILLQHTAYNLDSVFARLPSEKDVGITFEQYSDFCQLLNNLDDFGITLTIFTMANTPVTPDEFNKAVNACMGKSLDQVVVDTVFQIFDVDGDGKLSNDEFLTVMKNWKLRASKIRDAKAEGFWQEFRACIKSEVRHATSMGSSSQ